MSSALQKTTDGRTQSKLILVVEDDEDLRRMFRTALSVAGFNVRESGNGYDALVELEQHPPDLVVLDLDLPKVDGLSVQAEIAARVTPHVPVVIVTGTTVDLSQVHVACLLKKPVHA